MRCYLWIGLVVMMILVGAVLSQEPQKEKEKREKEVVRLATDKDEEKYRAWLPDTEDETLKQLFAKPLIFYSDKEMPRAYQTSAGIHAPSHNISATQPIEPYGNPNVEFPWGTPAGTHRCKEVNSFRFVHLPAPIIWWNEMLWREIHPQWEKGFVWEYPEKTVFGEVLLLKDPDGKWRTYELRTRTKVDGKWQMNAYRPVLTRTQLDTWLTNNANITLGKPNLSIKRLVNPHPKMVIDRKAVVDELPELPKEAVNKLLSLPFQSALGQEWITKDGEEGHAPTTKAAYSIIPKDYDGAYLKVDSKSCMSCHEGILKNADFFQKDRDWYGRVRGSDGIFSFHIFDPKFISYDGWNRWPNLRKELLDAGMLVEKKKK